MSFASWARLASERLLELDPGNIAVMEPKILALIGLDRIDDVNLAMEDLGKMIDEAGPGAAAPGWHCATTAIFASDSGDLELADSRWTRCLEEYPGETEVVPKAVHFYDSQGDYARSLEILRKAVESAPSSRVYRVGLAERMRGSGDAEAAEALLRAGTESEFLAVASGSWLDLAKHYQAVENYPAAAEAVGKAVALVRTISAPSPTMMLEYADSLLIAGEHDRALEIGWTWYGRAYWRTAVNTECKYLLLRHAFESLRCIRVQLATDLRNERSQRAIERIGATREGVLRKNRIVPKDGHQRSSVCYSIVPLIVARMGSLVQAA